MSYRRPLERRGGNLGAGHQRAEQKRIQLPGDFPTVFPCFSTRQARRELLELARENKPTKEPKNHLTRLQIRASVEAVSAEGKEQGGRRSSTPPRRPGAGILRGVWKRPGVGRRFGGSRHGALGRREGGGRGWSCGEGKNTGWGLEAARCQQRAVGMATDGRYRWPVPMPSADSRVRWPMPMPGADGRYRHPVLTPSANAQCQCPVLTPGTDARCRWPVPSLGVPGQTPLPTAGGF